MKFILEIDLDSAAFESHTDDTRDGGEIAMLLRSIASRINHEPLPASSFPIKHTNGDHIGKWSVEE
jgi:hypothetical protein